MNKIIITEPLPDLGSKLPGKYVNTPMKQNLIETQRRFGIYGQIFNWQKTGITVRLNAPIENVLNDPFLLLKVTPLWLPSTFFVAMNETYPTILWDKHRPWFLPVSAYFSQFADLLPISKAVTIFEEDNASLLSILAYYSLGWTGGLEYQFKIISNSTSQGKIIFSRLYDITRPLIFGAIEKTKTPFYIPTYSQSDRMKNSAVMQDLSSRNDIILSLPYSDKSPWKSNNILRDLAVGSLSANVRNYENPGDSYVALDIAESIQPSAGASSVSIQIWIRAMPDFQLIQTALPSRRLLQVRANALWDVDHGPMRVFGEGANIRYRDGDSQVAWSRTMTDT